MEEHAKEFSNLAGLLKAKAEPKFGGGGNQNKTAGYSVTTFRRFRPKQEKQIILSAV